MNTDQISLEGSDTRAGDPVWGAPQNPPRRWGLRETVTAVGVAAVIAGLGGAAIYAATESNSHAERGGHQGWGPGGPAAMAGGPGKMAGGPDGPPLHGEFVVADGNGGYRTVSTKN
jgi:hypothetical protein